MVERSSPRETPWKLLNEMRRYLALPYIKLYFALNGVAWEKGWRVYGRPLIQRHRYSSIEIGNNLHMRNWFSSNPLGVNHRCILSTWRAEAEIIIGDQVNLSGTTICAWKKIQIGKHSRIGANCTIIDTDFHPLDWAERRARPRDGQVDPVIIEDDVFIGMSSIVLKGTRIGAGAVIGAGSVVSGDIPQGAVAAGNPAQVIHQL